MKGSKWGLILICIVHTYYNCSLKEDEMDIQILLTEYDSSRIHFLEVSYSDFI
jgi:hypothetical protein